MVFGMMVVSEYDDRVSGRERLQQVRVLLEQGLHGADALQQQDVLARCR